MLRKMAICTLALAGLLSLAGTALADKVYLFGKIGDLPVGACLEFDQGKVAGWYFYKSKGLLIRLEGILDQRGALALEESAGGKKTGLFAGKVHEGRWEGTWRKDAQAAPLPFVLEDQGHQIQGLNAQVDCALQKRDAKYNHTYRWSLKLAVAEGKVKEFSSTQGSYADDGDEQTCQLDLGDLKQVAWAEGILLRAVNKKQFCTVRIVGDQDTLWLRFGEAGEEGNDCRALGDNMFCSPRAFWNDILVDRRTGKCLAVK